MYIRYRLKGNLKLLALAASREDVSIQLTRGKCSCTSFVRANGTFPTAFGILPLLQKVALAELASVIMVATYSHKTFPPMGNLMLRDNITFNHLCPNWGLFTGILYETVVKNAPAIFTSREI